MFTLKNFTCLINIQCCENCGSQCVFCYSFIYYSYSIVTYECKCPMFCRLELQTCQVQLPLNGLFRYVCAVLMVGFIWIYFQSGFALIPKVIISPDPHWCKSYQSGFAVLWGDQAPWQEPEKLLPACTMCSMLALAEVRFYFGKFAEDRTNIANHQMNSRCHFIQLLSAN